MTQSADLDIPKLGGSLSEVNLKLDEATDIFYESLKKFESVRKCMNDHEHILDSFKNGVVTLEKELDESKGRIVSDVETQRRLESTISSLEKKMEYQIKKEGQLKADYQTLECEKDEVLHELEHVKSLALDMGKDFQTFNKEVSRTSSCIGSFWKVGIISEEEERDSARFNAALMTLNVLDLCPENSASFQNEVRCLLSNVTNLHTRLMDLKVEVEYKLFINKESYDTMIFSLMQCWQLKVEEMRTLASKNIKELESSQKSVENELKDAKQSLLQKCVHEDELNEVIVGLLDEKQAMTKQFTETFSSNEELFQELDHSKSKLSKAENRIYNLETKGTDKDAMLLELSAELETISDLMTQEKQRNEYTIFGLKESLRKAHHKLVKESAASDSLAKEVFSLQQTLDESKNEAFVLSKKHQGALTEELKEQYKKLEDDVKGKGECLAEYEVKERKMSDELCALRKENNILKEQVSQVQSSQGNSSEEQRNIKKENINLREELTELKKLCEDLKNNNTIHESNKKELNNQLDSAISYKDELEQKNIIVEVENRNLRDQLDKESQNLSVKSKHDGSKLNIQMSKLKSLLRVKDSQLMELADELQSISDMHMKDKEENDKAISSLQQSLLNANYLSMELNAELDYLKGLYAKESEAHKATMNNFRNKMIGNELSIPLTPHKNIQDNNNKTVQYGQPSIGDVNCRSVTPTSNDSDEKRNDSTFTAKARANHAISPSDKICWNTSTNNSCNTSFSSYKSTRSNRPDGFKVAMYSTEMDNMSQAPKEKLQDKEVEIMYVERNTFV